MCCGSCPCPRNARATGDWDLLHSPLRQSAMRGVNGTSRNLTVPGEGLTRHFPCWKHLLMLSQLSIRTLAKWVWFLVKIFELTHFKSSYLIYHVFHKEKAPLIRGLFCGLWDFVKPGWQLYRQCGKTNKWRRWRYKLWFVVLFTSNHGPMYPSGEHTIPGPAQTCRRWLILNSTTEHSMILHPLLWKPTPYLLQSYWLLSVPMNTASSKL